MPAFTFDAENHLTSAGGQTYLYDGDGKRVEKASGSPLTANKPYWYGTEDSPVLETDAAGNELYRYFRFQGLLTTREEANDWVDHYGLDALGNVRWLYSYNGAWDVSDYYPFGGERIWQSNSTNTRKFTGKERDSESGLDNFGARYFGSSTGRFMSPDWSADPMPVPYASLPYPQSLNLYSYVQNNPLRSTDPTGHCTVDGETHGWLWCAGHALGLSETKKELADDERTAQAVLAWRKSEMKRTGIDPIYGIVFAAASVVGAMAVDSSGMGSAADGESTVTSEENTAIDAAAATGAEAGIARAILNGVPQPNPNGEIIVGPNGTAVKIPAGYVAAPAESGSGIVYRPAGSSGNANSIRIMGPDAQGRYPSGRVIIYNSQGQPTIPSTGKPGTRLQTHSPL